MKIAFVGKGGSGKTTLASLFVRHVASLRHPVMAIDADINQHFADALGIKHRKPVLGDRVDEIKDYLRDTNPLISSADSMLKSTPPGPGSRLLSVDGDSLLYQRLFVDTNGIRFAATGDFNSEDLGEKCFHSKTGTVELLLNHIVDREGEFVVVDMTAGADAFASSLFTRFDVTFLVCEPTLKSVGVYKQYARYAADYDVNIAVVGNKVDSEEDVDFLRQHVGDALLGWCSLSRYVKAAEKGQMRPIGELELGNRDVLDAVREKAMKVGKDWPKFTRQAHEFHRRAAKAWGNDRTGVDLTNQIVPEFVLGPDQL